MSKTDLDLVGDDWSAKFGKFALYCGMFAFAIWVAANVMTDMWLWFLVPLGIPAISLWHAAGLSLLIGWQTKGTRPDGRDYREIWFTGLFLALVVWGMGYGFANFGGLL